MNPIKRNTRLILVLKKVIKEICNLNKQSLREWTADILSTIKNWTVEFISLKMDRPPGSLSSTSTEKMTSSIHKSKITEGWYTSWITIQAGANFLQSILESKLFLREFHQVVPCLTWTILWAASSILRPCSCDYLHWACIRVIEEETSLVSAFRIINSYLRGHAFSPI